MNDIHESMQLMSSQQLCKLRRNNITATSEQNKRSLSLRIEQHTVVNKKHYTRRERWRDSIRGR
jgi:hypothetical protein